MRDAEQRGLNEADIGKGFDWQASPLGDRPGWPSAFRTVFDLCQRSTMPLAIYWGADFRLFYNRSWAPFLGARHPWAYGQPARAVWPELWGELEGEFTGIMADGVGVQRTNQMFEMWRNGAAEETFWDYSLTPISDEVGQVCGVFNLSTDRTAIVVAERQLRESEERQRLALSAAGGVGTWDWDITSDRVTTDQRFAAFYGVDARATLAGVPIATLMAAVHPDDRARLDAALTATLQTGSDLDHDYRTVRDDAEMWVSARAQCHFDAQGRPQRLRGVAIDITARKQTEALLKAADIRQAFLIDLDAALRVANSVDAILVSSCGPLGRLLGAGQVSWAMCDAEGLHATIDWDWNDGTIPSNAGRHRIADFGADFAADLHRGLTIAIDDIRADPRTATPAALATFRRAAIGAFLNVPLLHDGHLVGVLAVHHAGPHAWPAEDVAMVRKVAERMWATIMREQALAALRQSEARFQAITNSIDQMIWSTLPDGHHDFFNQRWYDYTGVPRGSTDGASWVGLFHPEDQERTVATWRASLANGEPYHIEYRLRHRSGQYRWVLGRAQPMHDEAGRIVRWYGTCTDIEEIMAAREVLDRSRADLEDLVAQRTDALMAAEAQLRQSQKMEAIGQLTGGIAHDFNNMLAVVIGSLDLLARRFATEDARARRYIDNAKDGARRAAMLTQRLLAFSRQQPLRPEPLDANRLVSSMSDLLAHALGTDIRLETVLAAGLWSSFADPNQLENVILNLAVNARDAMPDGGRLTIETQNTYFDERYAASNFGMPPGQYVMIAVTDTGCGMPADVIAKAFDPFFTTKEVGKGTGLGLSQVYGFVKQSDGHVKIYSEPGQGTTVKVYLPRRNLADRTGDVPLAAAPPGMVLGEQHELILVVEDEPAVRRFSVEALIELGYRVVEADGAAAALRLLKANPGVALLFTDIVMPDVNGRKLADAALVLRPGLRVLFTTGYTRNAVVHNGVLDAGVQLISKPFTIDALAAKLREVLDGPGPT